MIAFLSRWPMRKSEPKKNLNFYTEVVLNLEIGKYKSKNKSGTSSTEPPLISSSFLSCLGNRPYPFLPRSIKTHFSEVITAELSFTIAWNNYSCSFIIFFPLVFPFSWSKLQSHWGVTHSRTVIPFLSLSSCFLHSLGFLLKL